MSRVVADAREVALRLPNLFQYAMRWDGRVPLEDVVMLVGEDAVELLEQRDALLSDRTPCRTASRVSSTRLFLKPVMLLVFFRSASFE